MPIKRRGGVWYVDVCVGGRRARRSAGRGATREQARELERTLFDQLHRHRTGRAPDPPLSEALRRWLTGEAAGLRGIKELRLHVRQLLPYVTGKRTSEAPEAAQEALAAWQGTLAPATINRRLEALQRVSRLAWESWAWIETPVHQRIKKLPERNRRHIYLTQDEIEKLAQACWCEHVAALIRIAAWTGLRKGELRRVRPEHVTNGVLLVPESKTDRPRSIPLPPQIEPLVMALPCPLSEWQWRDRFLAAREAAGMAHVRWHDLRHTYASWLVQTGAHIRVVQELMGHSTVNVTAQYSHLSADHLRDAVTRLAAK